MIAAAPPPSGRRYAGVPGLPPAGGRGTGRSRALLAAARRPAAGPTSCTCPAAAALPLIRAAKAAALPVTAETCPHYLALRGRGRPGRRHPVQVLPADPRRRQPRPAVAGLLDGIDRLRGVRPLAVPPWR